MDFNQAAQKLGLGGPTVQPYRVGGPQIQPYGRYAPAMGAPAMAGQVAQQPVIYGPQQYQSGGNNYMGLGITPVGAGVRDTYTFKPIRSFQANEMRFPSTVVDLMVEQFTIQGVSFFASAPGQGVPIELFSEVSRMLGFDAVTIQPETGCSFTIFNPTAGTLNFKGALWGTQLIV